MDANVVEPIRTTKTYLSGFRDEIEGELEKISICGVYMTRKVTLSILGLFAATCVIIGVSVGIASDGVHERAFRPEHRFWSLGETIEATVGRDIYDNSTDEYAALVWLADSDPKRLDANSPMEEILERFVLANLYISTNGDEWAKKMHFRSKKSVCDWNDKTSGVFCNDDKQVSKLVLPESNLNGTIPHDIGLLSNIEIIDLSKNALKGSIPISIGIMSSLQTIDMSFNKISGKIPSSVAMLMELEILDLSYNELEGSDNIGALKDLPMLEEIQLSHNYLGGNVGQFGVSGSLNILDVSYNLLDGTIPHKFSDGKKLKSLRLNNNQIKGPLPDGIGRLYNLEELDFSFNELTGSIPSTFGDLKLLQTLKLNTNVLQFGLPPEIGFLNELTVLDVSDNGIESIPIEMFDMENLEMLYLASNRISRALPTEIGRATSLVVLDLSKNEIPDKLPSEIGKLVNLEVLDVSNNHFVGSVPSEYSNLYSLREMDISSNDFFGDMDDSVCSLSMEVLRADCLLEDITLSCATECCDGEETCCDVDDADCSFFV